MNQEITFKDYKLKNMTKYKLIEHIHDLYDYIHDLREHIHQDQEVIDEINDSNLSLNETVENQQTYMEKLRKDIKTVKKE